jgi:hypothetical protein
VGVFDSDAAIMSGTELDDWKPRSGRDGDSEKVLKAEEADEFGGRDSATARKSGSRREYSRVEVVVQQQHDAMLRSSALLSVCLSVVRIIITN